MKPFTYSPAAEVLLSQLEDSENGIIRIDPMEVLTAIELESWGEVKIHVKDGIWYVTKKKQ